MKTFLFWLASLTWGGIWTIVGLLAALAMLVTGHKPMRFGHAVYFETRKTGGGGVNFGPIFVVSKNPSIHTKSHEYGHGFQNICWGPLFFFVIAAPSFFRCQKYNWVQKHKPDTYLPPYDSIWFEGQATEWGTKAYEKYNKTN